jgi:hypothetical protein
VGVYSNSLAYGNQRIEAGACVIAGWRVEWRIVRLGGNPENRKACIVAVVKGRRVQEEYPKALGIVSSIDVVSDVAAACTVETTPRAISNWSFRAHRRAGQTKEKVI